MAKTSPILFVKNKHYLRVHSVEEVRRNESEIIGNLVTVIGDDTS